MDVARAAAAQQSFDAPPKRRGLLWRRHPALASEMVAKSMTEQIWIFHRRVAEVAEGRRARVMGIYGQESQTDTVMLAPRPFAASAPPR
jgi:hypothetical protein